jgi:oxygen-independent coproporphyrinogen-3 oxidase
MTEAGYIYIGMDHFAKPDDELATAQRQGRLHRNFQGYSTHSDCDLLAFGISSIGKVGPTYSQNVKTLDEYYDLLDSGTLPVYRGIELNADDLLRRSIIQSLMCHFELSIESIEIAHLIDFRKVLRDRTRRPARNGRRRPGARRRQVDHRSAARTHAGTGDFDGFRPLPAR